MNSLKASRYLGGFDYDEGMSIPPSMSQKSDPVVECDFSRCSVGDVRSRLVRLLLSVILIVATFVGMTATVPLTSGVAAESADDTDSSTITDTQNLLGGDLGKVNDAVKEVKAKAGVNLNLLYLSTFDTKEKPATWAAAQLESLEPAKNTVMLAVASEDGNLAVVVSKNSDSWLKNQGTVDSLSEAAVEPIVKNKTPDWSGAAIALAHKIEAVKADRDAAPLRLTAIIAGIVVAVALVGLIVFLAIRSARRRKTHRRHAAASHRSHRKQGEGTGVSHFLRAKFSQSAKRTPGADAEAEEPSTTASDASQSAEDHDRSDTPAQR